MCGISGILVTDPLRRDSVNIQAMTDALRHRGPDGEGFYCNAPVMLGHRRLAIIDPEGGTQPLCNDDESVWLVCNGEIYNFRELRHTLESAGHRFRTQCDVEVIVHAWEEWGEQCVEKLRGMYAFALWDKKKQRLILARDRAGIKPLYVAQLPGMVAFASELQALRELDAFDDQIDLQALDLYLHFQYVPAPRTIYKHVKKLEPAHYVQFDADGSLHPPRRYWQLEFMPNELLSEDEWVERLDAALRDSVEAHLVSDVPFGAFLSGGIDSSTVVAYMSEVMDQPVKTFSIGFDEAQYDETVYARQVAKQFGTEHYEEIVKPDALAILPELVRHYGEPFADSSAIPTYYVSRLASQHVKMVLSGDGGDEHFAGYRSYPNIAWAHRGPRAGFDQVKFLLGSMSRSIGLRPTLPSPADTWFDWTTYFNQEQRRRLWATDQHDLIQSSRDWFDSQMKVAPSDDLVSRFQHFDIHNYLSGDILTKVDIASMYHSLEVRVPLLDHNVMQLAAQIPTRWKLPATGPDVISGKHILKKTVERFFSPAFLNRQKQGFEAPIRDWFTDKWRDEVHDRLCTPASSLNPFFDVSFVSQLVDEHAIDKRHGGRLWSLLFLSEWLSQSHTGDFATASSSSRQQISTNQ